MQQTETYKLNLIETSDTFSPNPLNENVQKTEAAINAARAEAQAGDAALDSRVTAIEARKLVIGDYVGDGTFNRFINLGFTPTLVFVHSASSNSGGNGLAFADHPFDTTKLQVTTNGFIVGVYRLNNEGDHYYFVAIL